MIKHIRFNSSGMMCFFSSRQLIQTVSKIKRSRDFFKRKNLVQEGDDGNDDDEEEKERGSGQ